MKPREKESGSGGRELSRRQALGLVGVAGAATLAGYGPGAAQASALPALTCVVRPSQTEGPYFVDERLHRADIRVDPADGTVRAGAPLRLRLAVHRVDGQGCRPLEGAMVDVWQCDAVGEYSDVRDTAGRFDTRGRKFLRGYQVTDAEGATEFVTIYPGWYQGRTPHIHFKIRVFEGEQRVYEFTSQLYFSDAVSDEVYRSAAYAAKGAHGTRNEQDRIFMGGGTGAQLMLDVAREGEGWAGAFDVGLQLV